MFNSFIYWALQMCQHAAVFTQHAMINHRSQTSFCPPQKFPVLKTLLCLIGSSAAGEIVNKLLFIYDMLLTSLEMCPALFYNWRNPSANRWWNDDDSCLIIKTINRFLFNHSTGQESENTVTPGAEMWQIQGLSPEAYRLYTIPNNAHVFHTK